jgi:hypothetical protein
MAAKLTTSISNREDTMSIDYARMQKSGPKLKAQLTRATKIVDPMKRYVAVKAACVAAVTEWNAVGAWIDDWSHWQRALDDAFYYAQRTYRLVDGREFFSQRLEDL